jgi:hypothetical protein
MRKPLQSSRALRIFCLFSLAALSLLSGCGKVRGWLSQHRRGRALLSRVEKVRGWLTPVGKLPEIPHSVTITWIASKSSVLGYHVYRESQSGGPVKLTTRIYPGTAFTDTTVEPGQTYSYYVTSVSPKGMESAPSEKVTVTIPKIVAPPAK